MSRHHRPLVNSRRWLAVRRAVLDRDGWRCTSCGAPGALECDHVRPLRRGGDPYDMANLQTLCRACHIAKTRRENTRPKTPAELRWKALVATMRDAH